MMNIIVIEPSTYCESVTKNDRDEFSWRTEAYSIDAKWWRRRGDAFGNGEVKELPKLARQVVFQPTLFYGLTSSLA